jgi:uncharacterized membrane protein YccC
MTVAVVVLALFGAAFVILGLLVVVMGLISALGEHATESPPLDPQTQAVLRGFAVRSARRRARREQDRVARRAFVRLTDTAAVVQERICRDEPTPPPSTGTAS